MPPNRVTESKTPISPSHHQNQWILMDSIEFYFFSVIMRPGFVPRRDYAVAGGTGNWGKALYNALLVSPKRN